MLSGTALLDISTSSPSADCHAKCLIKLLGPATVVVFQLCTALVASGPEGQVKDDVSMRELPPVATRNA